MRIRALSWNVCYQRAAGPKVDMLRKAIADVAPAPCIVVLQEVVPSAREAFATALEATAYSLDYRAPGPFDRKNRRLGVLVGVTGGVIESAGVVARAPYPDRTLWAKVGVPGTSVYVLGAHALTGVDYKCAKADQFLALAEHLDSDELKSCPRILALDANEPKVDSLDPTKVEFFATNGPGAARLLGAEATHGLEDALRRWWPKDHPVPSTGPLATSHVTGSNRRYDQCFVSEQWQVEGCEYRYQDAVEAGSDHALLVVDLVLGEEARQVDQAPQRDGTPDVAAVVDVLSRMPIPPGQLALLKALREAGPEGLAHDALAAVMRDGDTAGLTGVLGGLGKRVNATPGFDATRPGTRFLVAKIEGRYRALPILLAAIEALPTLEQKLADSYQSIYAVRSDPDAWFRV